MSATCPRCQQLLQEQQLDEYLPRICGQCRGFLIRHGELLRILDQSWKVVPRKTAEAKGFPTPENWRSDPAVRCPDCRQPMEKYGYMGIGAIQIDRCDPCGLLWLDAAELQSMVLALAKTNYRLQQRPHPPVDIAAAGVATTAAFLGGARAEDEDWLAKGAGFTAAQMLLRLLLRG